MVRGVGRQHRQAGVEVAGHAAQSLGRGAGRREQLAQRIGVVLHGGEAVGFDGRLPALRLWRREIFQFGEKGGERVQLGHQLGDAGQPVGGAAVLFDEGEDVSRGGLVIELAGQGGQLGGDKEGVTEPLRIVLGEQVVCRPIERTVVGVG